MAFLIFFVFLVLTLTARPTTAFLRHVDTIQSTVDVNNIPHRSGIVADATRSRVIMVVHPNASAPPRIVEQRIDPANGTLLDAAFPLPRYIFPLGVDSVSSILLDTTNGEPHLLYAGSSGQAATDSGMIFQIDPTSMVTNNSSTIEYYSLVRSITLSASGGAQCIAVDETSLLVGTRTTPGTVIFLGKTSLAQVSKFSPASVAGPIVAMVIAPALSSGSSTSRLVYCISDNGYFFKLRKSSTGGLTRLMQVSGAGGTGGGPDLVVSDDSVFVIFKYLSRLTVWRYSLTTDIRTGSITTTGAGPFAGCFDAERQQLYVINANTDGARGYVTQISATAGGGGGSLQGRGALSTGGHWPASCATLGSALFVGYQRDDSSPEPTPLFSHLYGMTSTRSGVSVGVSVTMQSGSNNVIATVAEPMLQLLFPGVYAENLAEVPYVWTATMRQVCRLPLVRGALGAPSTAASTRTCVTPTVLGALDTISALTVLPLASATASHSLAVYAFSDGGSVAFLSVARGADPGYAVPYPTLQLCTGSSSSSSSCTSAAGKLRFAAPPAGGSFVPTAMILSPAALDDDAAEFGGEFVYVFFRSSPGQVARVSRAQMNELLAGDINDLISPHLTLNSGENTIVAAARAGSDSRGRENVILCACSAGASSMLLVKLLINTAGRAALDLSRVSAVTLAGGGSISVAATSGYAFVTFSQTARVNRVNVTSMELTHSISLLVGEQEPSPTGTFYERGTDTLWVILASTPTTLVQIDNAVGSNVVADSSNSSSLSDIFKRRGALTLDVGSTSASGALAGQLTGHLFAGLATVPGQLVHFRLSKTSPVDSFPLPATTTTTTRLPYGWTRATSTTTTTFDPAAPIRNTLSPRTIDDDSDVLNDGVKKATDSEVQDFLSSSSFNTTDRPGLFGGPHPTIAIGLIIVGGVLVVCAVFVVLALLTKRGATNVTVAPSAAAVSGTTVRHPSLLQELHLFDPAVHTYVPPTNPFVPDRKRKKNVVGTDDDDGDDTAGPLNEDWYEDL